MFKSCSGGKQKANCLCRERQARNRKYAAICGVTAAIRKFQSKFPNLTESTVRPWVKSYKKSEAEEGRSTIAYRGSTQSQVTFNARKSTISWCWYQHSRSLWCTKWLDSRKPRKIWQIYGL